MPSIVDLDVPRSPRDDPLSYPGTVLRNSYLWWDSWFYDVEVSASTGPGVAAVIVDGGPLAIPGAAPIDMDAALTRAGVAAAGERYPVIAYGSNAAPAQLLDKFERLAPSGRVLPVLAGRVGGFALAHSAHVSNPGYVPYVLVDGGPGAELPVQVLLLDAEQLAVLNETEPNYTLVPVNADRYRLTLRSGERLPAFSAYRGNWGALRWPGERAPAAASTQQQVLTRLAGIDWFAELVGAADPAGQLQRLRSEKVLRDRIRNELAANAMVVADGWI